MTYSSFLKDSSRKNTIFAPQNSIQMKKMLVFACLLLTMVGCGKKQVQLIDAANFNKEVDGKQVSLYTLKNGDVTMQVTNYGGRVVALWTG